MSFMPRVQTALGGPWQRGAQHVMSLAASSAPLGAFLLLCHTGHGESEKVEDGLPVSVFHRCHLGPTCGSQVKWPRNSPSQPGSP